MAEKVVIEDCSSSDENEKPTKVETSDSSDEDPTDDLTKQLEAALIFETPQRRDSLYSQLESECCNLRDLRTLYEASDCPELREMPTVQWGMSFLRSVMPEAANEYSFKEIQELLLRVYWVVYSWSKHLITCEKCFKVVSKDPLMKRAIKGTKRKAKEVELGELPQPKKKANTRSAKVAVVKPQPREPKPGTSKEEELNRNDGESSSPEEPFMLEDDQEEPPEDKFSNRRNSQTTGHEASAMPLPEVE